MPKLVVNAFLTLDGVMQAPGGPEEDPENSFTHGGWMAPVSSEEVGKRVVEGIADADGFLLGRKTYDLFAGYWPKQTDPANPVAAALNGLPKYVASRRAPRLGWNAARLLEGDVVAALRRLREAPGRTVHTWGSTELLQILLKHDLVDEYRLFTFPVVLGAGKRLFGSGTAPAAFQVLEAALIGKGGTYLRLARSGKPAYGSMGG